MYIFRQTLCDILTTFFPLIIAFLINYNSYKKELSDETKSLQDVWTKIAQLKQKNEYEMNAILSRPEFTFTDPDTHITLNVGGQLFDVTVSLLTRDPYSILAACCRQTPDPNLKIGSDGVIFFDRDWWLFRHILSYLRSNILPNELETLKELYLEASYYRLESLQRSIEEIPVDRLSNLTPQIAVTMPNLVRKQDADLRRDLDSHVLSETLFR